MPETPKKRVTPTQVSQNPIHKPKGKPTVSTAGKLYRVRDKAAPDGSFTTWGEDLSYTEAWKLKEQVVTSRKSKTARVEEMPEDEAQPEWTPPVERPLNLKPTVVNPDAIGDPDQTPVVTLPHGLVDMMVESGQVTVVASSCRDNGQGLCVACPTVHPMPIRADSFVSGDAQLPDAELEAARQKAVAAAAPIARTAQAKQDHRKVVMNDPPKPPPSPLSDELLEDLPDISDIPEDELLKAGDVQNIIADVGGGPGDDDKERAAKQAKQDLADSIAAAIVAYGSAVSSDKHPDTWPEWDELGPFEQAAWRYYAANGGKQPELTRTMRAVGVSMRKAAEEEQP